MNGNVVKELCVCTIVRFMALVEQKTSLRAGKGSRFPEESGADLTKKYLSYIVVRNPIETTVNGCEMDIVFVTPVSIQFVSSAKFTARLIKNSQFIEHRGAVVYSKQT